MNRLLISAGVAAALLAAPFPRADEPAKKLEPHEEMLLKAEAAAYDYDIDAAESILDDYAAYLKKNKKKKLADRSGEVRPIIDKISSMLDRVEKIAVIDSINVAKADFFDAYRLSPESGTIRSAATLPAGLAAADPTAVYQTEDGRMMMWGAPGDDGKTRLESSALLSDGTWEPALPVGDHLGQGGSANYPFLMPDGVTLYFASDCEESLGGYDIFISRNNGSEFLQPQNIGMPYNSVYDDYLLAIDELNGVGWWATDRNQLGDSLTVYVFIPSELRINVDRDDPTLAARARISSIAATQDPDADYSALLARVASILPSAARRSPEFFFPLPDGKVATRFADFRSPEAREEVRNYVDLTNQIADLKQQLDALYRAYGKGDTSVAQEIRYLERDLLDTQRYLRKAANDVVKAASDNP